MWRKPSGTSATSTARCTTRSTASSPHCIASHADDVDEAGRPAGAARLRRSAPTLNEAYERADHVVDAIEECRVERFDVAHGLRDIDTSHHLACGAKRCL